ncbi:MAG: hypothetical protein CFE40_12690 [Burkholderiales bacterium PBB1]|nr:MAG: hypothetical protein CFE40_12690 [Burkholderiales bacterium PBB1]
MPSDTPFTIVIEPQGWSFEASGGPSLVESARRAGIVLPTSCRNGTCRACLCRVLRGQARHLIEWPGLSAEEKREGCILPCVATPETALHIEAPKASRAPPPAPPAALGP